MVRELSSLRRSLRWRLHLYSGPLVLWAGQHEAGQHYKDVGGRTFHGKVHQTSGRATIYQEKTVNSCSA